MSMLSLRNLCSQRWFYRDLSASVIRCKRTLFSEKILRIDEYVTQRSRVPYKHFNIKRVEFALNTNDMDGLIDATKQWVHAMDKTHSQMAFPLLQRCLRQIYNYQTDETKPKQDNQTYNFGPLIMRMMYYFNTPQQALQIHFDPQLSGMFNQLSCTIILCDLLFNNGMYRDIVNIIQRRQDNQKEKVIGTNRYQNYLLFAACYKLNTAKDWEYALEMWNNCEKQHQLTQSMNFLAMLAINQRQIGKALEILPSIDKHFSAVNVRILAHCEGGQYTEAIDLIEKNYKNHSISSAVIDRIRMATIKNNLTNLTERIDNLLQKIIQTRHLLRMTIDEIVCWPISNKMQNYSSKSKKSSRQQFIEGQSKGLSC